MGPDVPLSAALMLNTAYYFSTAACAVKSAGGEIILYLWGLSGCVSAADDVGSTFQCWDRIQVM